MNNTEAIRSARRVYCEKKNKSKRICKNKIIKEYSSDNKEKTKIYHEKK